MKKIPASPPADLWSFALACYERPGVEQASLDLQAKGADVCLLLCAAWLESRAIECRAPRVAQLKTAAENWQSSVVEPLRQLRHAWKTSSEQDPALARLRERIKELELDAERVQLARLEESCRGWEERSMESGWLARLAPDTADRAALQQLRDAAHETQLALASG